MNRTRKSVELTTLLRAAAAIIQHAKKPYLWYCNQLARLACKKVGRSLLVGGRVYLGKNAIIGNYVSINGLQIKGNSEVEIQDFTHFGYDCLIIAGHHNYNFGKLLPYDETNVDRPVSIGKACWIGDRVTILGGVKIGAGCVIQAGAVVASDIPPLAVAGGNPARPFKTRDAQHFKALEDQDAFLKW